MRKTKIICTLGPSTEDDQILKDLMVNGMDVARLNFSHGNHESHQKVINRIKNLRKTLDLPVAILLDTGGPEIRLGNFAEGSVVLVDGQNFTLKTEEVSGDSHGISITYKNLYKDVTIGNHILIDDGLVEMEVQEISGTDIVCKVIHGGKVSDHKGVNVPNVELTMPYINEKDKKDIAFGVENQVDYIAASFVRSAKDIQELRSLLHELHGEHIKIISKIENRQGVDNLEEILELSDGIMVARGDLGVEIPIREIPSIQKKMINKIYHSGKIAITATQMLDSMMKNPRPTRAETTDVANAIYDGTSAIMLSGETAAGLYPVEALKTMVEIAEYTESDINYDKRFRNLDKLQISSTTVTDAISHATCMTAIDVDARAIITVTKSGRTARMISRYRPKCPILGATPDEHTYYQLSLSWGVKPMMMKEETNSDKLLSSALLLAREQGLLKEEELAVITAGLPLGVSGNTNLLRVMSCKNDL